MVYSTRKVFLVILHFVMRAATSTLARRKVAETKLGFVQNLENFLVSHGMLVEEAILIVTNAYRLGTFGRSSRTFGLDDHKFRGNV